MDFKMMLVGVQTQPVTHQQIISLSASSSTVNQGQLYRTLVGLSKIMGYIGLLPTTGSPCISHPVQLVRPGVPAAVSVLSKEQRGQHTAYAC